MKTWLNTQLIMLDGLPGLGKSTTAQWLTGLLKEQINATFIPESETTHPLWWYEFWDGTEYQTPDFERFPIQLFMQTSLNKWRAFIARAEAMEQLYVVESFFFQNTIGMFIMGGAEPGSIKAYAHEGQQIIRPLNPILIYFRQDDPASALRRICSLRGKEFEEELIHNMESFPFLRHRQLKGLDGVATLWQNIQAITDALYDEYAIRKVAVETSTGDWSNYRQQILERIGIIQN